MIDLHLTHDEARTVRFALRVLLAQQRVPTIDAVQARRLIGCIDTHLSQRPNDQPHAAAARSSQDTPSMTPAGQQ